MIFAEHFLREDKSFGASRKKRFPDETGESFFSLKDRKKRGLQASDSMMTARAIFTIVKSRCIPWDSLPPDRGLPVKINLFD